MNLIKEKYWRILEAGINLDKTSSILQPEDFSLTFARNEEYLKLLLNCKKYIHVIIPNNISRELISKMPSNIHIHALDEGDDIEYVFTYIHNKVNKTKIPKPNVIGKNVNIHETSIVGVHGNTYCVCPDGSKLQLKHMGNVVIKDNVDVEALSIVHRAGMLSTVIGKGSKICVMVNFGHNCICGKNNFFAPGVLLGGGTEIGDDCYFWQGVITRSNIKICSNVIIGAGSLVMHDITEPGVYFGRPAKFIKPNDGSFLR